MTLPTTFASLTEAEGAELDGNFNAVGALTTIRATAVGVNAVVLTPVAGYPAVTAYGLPYPVRFGFVAAGTSTGSVTIQVGSLAALPLYLSDGTTQAGSGSILTNIYYEIVYVSSYNTGSGGFALTAPLPASSTPIALGSTRNLKIVNNSVTPNTKVDITAAQAIMVTSTGSPIFAASVSVTCDLTTTGANGMDTGSRPTSGWAYLYLISNGSATASLASATSPTSGNPSFPAGYIYSTYVGAMWLDGSQNLFRSRQQGNVAHWAVTASTNTATAPNIVNGTQGTYSAASPVLAAASITSVAPLTASVVQVSAVISWKGGSASNVLVAPGTGWGGVNNGPTGSNGQIYPIWMQSTLTNSNMSAEIPLEASSIAVALDAAGGAVNSIGWTDGWSR